MLPKYNLKCCQNDSELVSSTLGMPEKSCLASFFQTCQPSKATNEEQKVLKNLEIQFNLGILVGHFSTAIYWKSILHKAFFSTIYYIHSRQKMTFIYLKSNKKWTHQTFVLMKTSWRRLQDVFRLRLQKTYSRRLQDVLIKTNIFVLVLRLQKTSSRRLQDVLVKTNIFVLAIRLQDVFKTFSRRLQDVLPRCLQDVFKTSSRRLARTSSRHLQDVSSS